MRRFRVLFAALSLAILAPLALLAERAVRSLWLERQIRQRTVAERIFDEMERGLSRLLETEEQQPFDRYGADVTPREPAFVIGRFQVDPDDGVHALPMNAPPGDRAAELLDTVGSHWRAAARRGATAAAGSAQLPGTTVEVDDKGRAALADTASNAREELAAQKDVSAFDALRSLNKGALERTDRQYKASQDEPAALARRDRFAAAERLQESRPAASLGSALTGGGGSAIDLPSMTGRIIDPSHLVLQRTMAWGRQAYRQGVLLDVARLGDWLSEQGLGDDGLADYASVSFATPFGEGETHATGSEFVYRHRFGEPFDDLTARLELRPLPGAASAAYVYALAALLLASVVFGLGALYRMVSVMVGYAERRSNFVAAVSHELKTPLTAIRMYGEMLQGGMVASEAKREEYYGHITAESERLSRLINNVLELARLENGRPRTSGGSGLENTASTTGSPAPVVREVAALLGPHARERGFALDVRIDEGLPPVRFERDALVQMLCNLVDNALKYAGDAAEKRITLCCRRAGSGVSVGVRDRGTGVPPRHLGKIFEPFYRGERELTRTGKGVGLGLALVRGLAERMGARVDGRNASDGGFEVEILLGP